MKHALKQIPRAATGRRRKAPIEIHLQRSVADMLAADCAPGWVWTHFPAGEARDVQTGARLKRMGTKRGWPDLILIAPPSGRFHGLELKRRGQKPTDDQMDRCADFRAAGGLWEWADDFDDAVAILRRWGALQGLTSRRIGKTKKGAAAAAPKAQT